jgi:hypothetical protein
MFAPADAFAAVAIGTRQDPDLPDGIHLRLLPSAIIGFPAAPFAVVRLVPELVFVEEITWSDSNGIPLPNGNLDAANGYLVGDIAASQNTLDVALVVDPGPEFSGRVALVDRLGHVLAESRQPPFAVAAPRVDRVVVEGHRSQSVIVHAWRLQRDSLISALDAAAPDLILRLPIDGALPWYGRGLGDSVPLDRVTDAHPLRLTPADRPNGPFASLTAADERLRVLAHKADILDACQRMLGDPATMPNAAQFPVPGADTSTPQVDVGIAGALLGQAMDPGIGRYLGLVGYLKDDHVEPDGLHPVAFAAVAPFPVDRFATLPDDRPLLGWLGDVDPAVQRLSDRMLDFTGGKDTLEALRAQHGSQIELRPLIAVAGAVPAPQPPMLPALQAGAARWLDGGGRPSQQFQQAIVVTNPPLGSLVALGRRDGGSWKTAHRTIDLPPPANPAKRALALLLGRTRERPPLRADGLVEDPSAPASADISYRAALADLFGRFGPPQDLAVAEPARPAPPAPAPQVSVEYADPAQGMDGQQTPGRAIVEVPVPSVSLLAAGALDLATLEVSVDGSALPPVALPLPPPGTTKNVTVPVSLRALSVGETGHAAIAAAFRDSAGTRSASAEVPISFTDQRHPPIVRTAPGLIWTSRPGPSSFVELRLIWGGQPHGHYRAYIADERSLGLTGASRADLAADAEARDRTGTLPRGRFRLLTDPPIEADADGRATLVELLPRALATVQIVRIVPLTPTGREAPFDGCGIVPVAVPTDRRPPPPRVTAQIVPGSRRATITIDAVGLDLVSLRAEQPGLFADPADPAATPPSFRLRRATGPVADPLYARPVQHGPLRVLHVGNDVILRAEVVDPGPLQPFVRYSYYAEVRMPPERRVASGAGESPTADGVTGPNPAQMTDLPRPFSAISTPATVLDPVGQLPLQLTAAEAAVTSVAGQVTATLSATAGPVAHPRAVGPYTVRIWERWGTGPLALAGPDLPLGDGTVEWRGQPRPATSAAQPTTVSFVVRDPLGGEGAFTTLQAPLSAWEPLGGLFTALTPAACAPGPGQLAIFGQGLDSQLYWRHFDGSEWSAGWDALGLVIPAGAPAVAASPGGAIHLIVQGNDENGYYRRFDNGAWGPWLVMPGGLAAALAITAASASDLHVFGIRYQSIVQDRVFDGSTWTSWRPLPGPLLAGTAVAAAAGAEGRIDIVVRGTDSLLNHRARTAGSWGEWTALGGLVAASGPAVARVSPWALDVVAQGTDDRLHRNRMTRDGWTGWRSIEDSLVGHPPAAASAAPGRLDLSAARADRQMYYWSRAEAVVPPPPIIDAVVPDEGHPHDLFTITGRDLALPGTGSATLLVGSTKLPGTPGPNPLPLAGAQTSTTIPCIVPDVEPDAIYRIVITRADGAEATAFFHVLPDEVPRDGMPR